MGYKIGSFNVRNLNFQSSREVERDFKMIARIIEAERFDIIALQEVLTENVIRDRILPNLSQKKNWHYCWLAPAPRTGGDRADKRGEGYAYIWNTNRIDLVHSQDERGEMRTFEPVIWRQYPKKFGGAILREPYYARFSPAGIAGGPFFELRLINTHIIFGNTVSERRTEYDKLLRNVYVNVANRRYGDNKPAYTVMLGDYNLSTKDIAVRNEITVETIRVEDFLGDRVTRSIITVQNQPTTLSRSQQENGEMVATDYSKNDYDHFSYTKELEGKMRLWVHRVDAVNKYYGNSQNPFEEYWHKVSDHVPISMVIDLKRSDISE